MTFALGIIIGLALFAAAVGVDRYVRVRRELRELKADGLAKQVGHLVAIHSRVGKGVSVRGVLVRVHRDGYALANAEWLSEASPANLGGEVFFPREQVAFFQVFGAASPRDPGKPETRGGL